MSIDIRTFRNRIRPVIIIACILLSIALGVVTHFYYRIEPLVSMRLKETIKTSTNDLYDISFSRLKINPFSGNVTIRDIIFRPRNSTYQRFKRLKINPSHLYDIRVNAIYLKRVHPLKVYLNRELVINSIEIDQPRIRVYYDKLISKDSSKVDRRTAWQRLSPYIRSVNIKKVYFREIDFKYIDKTIGKAEINGIRNLSISINDILIDSLSHLDKTRLYYTKEVLAEVYHNHFDSNDGRYSIKFDKLELSTSKRYAELRGLRVLPKNPPLRLPESQQFRKPRYLISTDLIAFRAVDYKKLIDFRQLEAGRLDISNARLDIFINKTLPRLPEDRINTFPHRVFRQLRLSTKIDTVEIVNSALHYSEYDPALKRTGRINFSTLSGKVLSLSNDSAWLVKRPWINANFRGYIYGKGRLDFNLNLNLVSPVQEFRFSGSLRSMPIKAFNPIARPLALLDLNSGMIDSAAYQVEAYNRRATGYIKLHYNNLNVGILRLTREGKVRKSTIRSLVANNVLLKSDNPSPGSPLRTGAIQYQRPDSVTFYGMIWRSLFTGIRETIGLTPEREKAISAQFKHLNTSSGEDRKEKKLRRKKRRIDRSNRLHSRGN